MKQHFTAAVIGAGGRGSVYTELMCNKEEFSVVAACDRIPKKLENLPNAMKDPGGFPVLCQGVNYLNAVICVIQTGNFDFSH